MWSQKVQDQNEKPIKSKVAKFAEIDSFDVGSKEEAEMEKSCLQITPKEINSSKRKLEGDFMSIQEFQFLNPGEELEINQSKGNQLSKQILFRKIDRFGCGQGQEEELLSVEKEEEQYQRMNQVQKEIEDRINWQDLSQQINYIHQEIDESKVEVSIQKQAGGSNRHLLNEMNEKEIQMEEQKHQEQLEPPQCSEKNSPLAKQQEQIFNRILSDMVDCNVLQFNLIWENILKEKVDNFIQHRETHQEQTKILKAIVLVYMLRSFRRSRLFSFFNPEAYTTMERLRMFFNIPDINRSYQQYRVFSGHQFDNSDVPRRQFPLQFKGIHRLPAMKEEIRENQILHLLLQQADQISRGLQPFGNHIIVNQVRLHALQYFNQSKIFDRHASRFSDALVQIKHGCKDPKYQREGKINAQFLENIELERLSSPKCFGCTKFLCEGLPIRTQSANVLNLPSVDKFLEKQSFPELTQYICGLLNSSGGVILFDVKYVQRKLLPQGAILTQGKKQRIRQKIMTSFPFIEPSAFLGDMIRVDFLPIILNPFTKQIPDSVRQRARKQGKLIERPYLRGIFVTRVRVSPLDSAIMYCLKGIEGESQYYVLKQEKVERASGIEVAKLAKKKIEMFYVPEERRKKYNNLGLKPQNVFNHNCDMPDTGWILDYHGPDQILTKRVKKERQYRYMYVLVAKQEYLYEIKRILSMDGRGCSIQILFSGHGFQSARHTSTLFHNSKRNDILRMLKGFNMRNHPPLLVIIMKFLLLKERGRYNKPSRGQFKKLRNWFKIEFPHESLNMYEYKANPEGTLEYYIEAESKTAALFLYYVIKSFNEKVMFAEPQGLSQLESEEREERWRLIYTNRPSSLEVSL